MQGKVADDVASIHQDVNLTFLGGTSVLWMELQAPHSSDRSMQCLKGTPKLAFCAEPALGQNLSKGSRGCV